jgi:hypothetical protein
MKSLYQNVLLTIIAACLIVITLQVTGIISKSVSVKINEIEVSNRPQRGGALPVIIMDN